MKKNTTSIKTHLSPKNLAQQYHAEAKSKLEEEKYNEAIGAADRAMTIYEKIGRWEDWLLAFRLKGAIFFEQGNFKGCLQIAQQGLEVWQKHVNDVPTLEVSFYNFRGSVYAFKAQFQQALEAYERALAICESSKKVSGEEIIETYGGLSFVLSEAQYESQKGLDYLQKSLEIAQKKEINEVLPKIYNKIGRIHYQLGNLNECIHFHQASINNNTNQNDNVSMADALTGISGAYFTMNNFGETIRYAYKAFEYTHSRGVKSQDNRAIIYTLLGGGYVNLGKLDDVLHYFQQAIDIWRQLLGEYNDGIAYTLEKIAFVHASKKEYDLGIKYLEKSIAIFKTILGENHTQVGRLYRSLGIFYFESKQLEKSLEYYEKSVQVLIHRPLLSSNQLAITYRHLTEYFRFKKEYTTALEYVHKSLKCILEQTDSIDYYQLPDLKYFDGNANLYRILYLRMSIFHRKYHHENQSLKDLKAAHLTIAYINQVVKLLRNDFKAETSQSIISLTSLAVGNHMIGICKELYAQTQDSTYSKECFLISENQKAHLLRTAMKDTEAKIQAKIPKKLLEEEQHLRQQIAKLNRQITKIEHQNQSTEQQTIHQLQSQLFDIEMSYRQLIKQFEREYPEYYQFKHQLSSPKVQDIQTYLQRKRTKTPASPMTSSIAEAVVSYFVGRSHIYIFFITPTTYQVYEIQKPKAFKELIATFNAAINTVEIEEFQEAACQLYELLIEPLSLKEKSHHLQSLTILRHDVLHYLSFDALIFPPPNQDFEAAETFDFHDLDYLVYHFDISYHYSATLLLHSEKRQEKTQQQAATFLGFAPVVFDDKSEQKKLALATHRGQSKVLKGNAQYFASLGNLPNTATEVNEIYQLFHQKSLSAKAFLYGAASKKNLLKEVANHKYVLISTHGFNYDKSGNLSGIHMSNVNNQKSDISQDIYARSNSKTRLTDPSTSNQLPENAILTTSESYLLSLQADLVVLSSCSSGIGALQIGEGMMALHRGFLYAGASNIIFTQFDIPDETSSLLVKQLFVYILEGDTYATALRKAKLHILQQEGISPQDWAAFALIGG